MTEKTWDHDDNVLSDFDQQSDSNYIDDVMFNRSTSNAK